MSPGLSLNARVAEQCFPTSRGEQEGTEKGQGWRRTVTGSLTPEMGSPAMGGRDPVHWRGRPALGVVPVPKETCRTPALRDPGPGGETCPEDPALEDPALEDATLGREAPRLPPSPRPVPAELQGSAGPGSASPLPAVSQMEMLKERHCFR